MPRFMVMILLIVSSFDLSGCAKGANQVIPAAVPTLEYERMSCAELGVARARNLEVINALSISQERASSNDTYGVALIGLPVGSMTGGDREAELAVAKGRDLAIKSTQAARKCP